MFTVWNIYVECVSFYLFYPILQGFIVLYYIIIIIFFFEIYSVELAVYGTLYMYIFIIVYVYIRYISTCNLDMFYTIFANYVECNWSTERNKLNTEY